MCTVSYCSSSRRRIAQNAPGDAEGQIAQVAFDNIDGEPKLVKSLLLEAKISELDIAGPDSDVELSGIQVVDLL